MNKLYLILLTSFFAFNLNASHIKGGEIYYDYVSGTTYDIYLVLFTDASGIPSPNTQTITVHNGVLTSNYAASLVSSVNYPVGCATTFKNLTYKATVNLGAIPASGLELRWSECCRVSSIDNLSNPGSHFLVATTKMYLVPGTTNSSSSARFYRAKNFSGTTGTNAFNTGAFDPDAADSTFVSLVAPLGSNGAISYASGYSATNPFGTTVNTTLDQNTGLLSVSGAATGFYQVDFEVESYTNGVLTSVIRRDAAYLISSLNDSMPQTQISAISSTGTVSMINGIYYVEMNQNDVLTFTVEGFVNSFDTLTLRGYSAMLTNNSGAGGNCSGSNCMNFTSASASFSNLIATQGTVSFSPNNTLIPPGADALYYNLVFESAVQGSCNENVHATAVLIKVNANQSIWAPSSFKVCQGNPGQIQINGDTTNLHWSPSIGVSDTTSASPFLFPATATAYTITNLNNGDQITLQVKVDSIIAPFLTANATHAFIPNYADYDGVVWYYNGVAIAQNVDSVAMPVAGSYFAIVTKGACSVFSDTITFTNKTQIPVNGNIGGAPISVDADGTYNMQFMINGYSNTLNSMVLVIADNMTLKTSTPPAIEIKNSSNQVVYSGSATAIDDVIWEVTGMNLVLNANEAFSMEVVVDAGDIALFAPTAFPYTESNGVVTVTSASYNNGSAQTDAFPYVVFGVANGIGIEENMQSARIYPQPMRDVLMVEISGTAQFEILDAAGRVLISSTITDKTEVNTSALPAGVYIYKLQQNRNVKTGKLLK